MAPRAMTKPPTFELRVPLARDHWIWITSNREMKVEHFRRLHQYLALQREASIEDDKEEAGAASEDTPTNV
jgi:hypothetical protein